MSEHLSSSYILNRYIARTIDFLIAAAMVLVLPPVGPLAGLLYILIADGFREGQSPGKQLIGLKVVRAESDLPITFMESILRNIPFAIVYLFFIIPFLGWILLIIIGIPILLFESYLVCTDEKARRIGDTIAQTMVVES
ncbi:MAG: RDD family protein [Proteobacteria bacterium]|nr:RDD family protein [Pseudomonadota bacterium]